MENGSLTSTFTGPLIVGLFSLQVGAPADLAVYCGTFTGRQPEELPDGGNGPAPPPMGRGTSWSDRPQCS